MEIVKLGKCILLLAILIQENKNKWELKSGMLFYYENAIN